MRGASQVLHRVARKGPFTRKSQAFVKDREGDASQLNRLIFVFLTTLARDQGLKPHCLGRGVFPGLKSGASTSKASTIGLNHLVCTI
jgi:hypothetical protein